MKVTENVWVFFNNYGENIWFLRWFSLCISSNIYSFPTCENEKENLCDFLDTSPMVSMLGWFLYLTMVFEIGSLVLFTIGSLSAYSGI